MKIARIVVCLFCLILASPVLAENIDNNGQTTQTNVESSTSEVEESSQNSQANANNPLDKLLHEVEIQSKNWGSVIKDKSENLFWILVTIEVAWTFILLLLKQADMSQFIAEYVRRIMFVGFFWSLFLYGPKWAAAIVDSLVQIGKEATANVRVSEGAVFDTGMSFVLRMFDTISPMNPIDSLTITICALLVMICFALVSAVMVVTRVEMYLVLGAGVILLGFGGSRWTSSYAKNYLTYSLSIGMKLMGIFLVASIGQHVMSVWLNDITNITMTQSTVLVGAMIVYLVMILAVPKILASLVNHGGYSSSDALMSVTSVLSTTVMAANNTKLAQYLTK